MQSTTCLEVDESNQRGGGDLKLFCVIIRMNELFVGKDAAGIAMEAISHAKESNTDIVLIDTAGRMQDNEPLMRALAKVGN